MLLAFGAVGALVPLYWMLITSLKTAEDAIRPLDEWSQWVVREPQFDNYPTALRTINFGRCLANTTLITVVNVVGTILASSVAAFAFAYLRFPRKHWIFLVVLSTMMLPGVVMMIPLYIMFRQLGWIDTFKPLIIGALFGSPFAIFLFRQFFLGLPRELVEAARVDGATSLQIYATIIMPLSKPVIATVAIFVFMASWNDFMGPLIYLNSDENWTLSLALASFQGYRQSDWHLMMAASLVVMLPVVVLFFLAQRHFVRGIAATGTKG